VTGSSGFEARCQLYRLLGEPARLRLLALAAEEELALGELAELLGEPLPNVSRHAAPLRQAGLLSERKHGTRTFVQLAPEVRTDPLIADALTTGRALCDEEGSLARVPAIIREREARTREFFARAPAPADGLSLASELPAYLMALRELIPARDLAVDAGTGDGALLDTLAPLFRRVVAIDRSAQQLKRAAERVAARGYSNVDLFCAELDDDEVALSVGVGADLVMASRVLHHAPKPRATLAHLVGLLKPGGRLTILDYQRHADEAFRERQADVWNGFEAEEIEAHARAAGLSGVRTESLPEGLLRGLRDGHVGFQVLTGFRPLPKKEIER
jgi:ArsR family transcriptional regulator